MDKTLVNVEDHVDYCSAYRELESRGYVTDGVSVPETYWGRCTLRAMAVLVALAGTDRWAEASRIIEKYEVEGAKRSTPMPGLREFIRGASGYRKAVVTLLGEEGTRIVLEKHGISVDVAVPRRPDLRPKPHGDQVAKALELLGARPDEAVMVGDSEWDEEAALNAGVGRFIGVTNGREAHRFRTPYVVSRLDEALRYI